MRLLRFLPACAAALLLALGACDSPSAPPEAAPPLQAPEGPVSNRLDCVANRRLQTVTCRDATAGPDGARAAMSVIMGGQGVYVRTVTNNITVAADTFAFDLRLVNLRAEPIGTIDGTTADPAGSKIFFSGSPPVSTTQGTGQVTVANPDGVGAFTAANQPYFQYVEILEPGDTSAAKRWKLRFDPGVERFSFHLLVQTSTGLVFHSLSAGAYHSCGTDAYGHVLCWGQNQGLGTQDASYPVTQPSIVPFDSAAALARAGTDNCALTPGGYPFCWGPGYLGGGVPFYRPHMVAGSPAFVTMEMQAQVACGLTAAGQAYCWGVNSWGQLGNGTLTWSQVPQPVSGNLTFTQISVSGLRVCGVTTTGAAYCWGNNEYGALGAPTTERCPLDNQGNTLACSTVPVAVTGGVTFASVSASWGSYFVCGVTPQGAGYCWGRDELGGGNLGTGVPGDAASPAPVAGGHTFSQIAAGDLHACGIEAGKVYCWGRDFVGINSTTPAAIPGTLSFTSISAATHTCGMATDGKAYCWGRNSEGQLGDGTTTPSATPVKVAKQF
jgi:alpha-tubulin suppressor-like RCC1 family protein